MIWHFFPKVIAQTTHLIISIRIFNVLGNEANGLNRCEHFRCERSWDDNLFTLCKRAEEEARKKQSSHQENSIRKMPQQTLAWMMLVIGMTHVVVALVIILVFIWIFSDTVSVMISEKTAVGKVSTSHKTISTLTSCRLRLCESSRRNREAYTSFAASSTLLAWIEGKDV